MKRFLTAAAAVPSDGHNLTVRTFTINGEKKKGVLTAADLPGIIVGEGSVEVSSGGFGVFIR